jgi:hypothetical protein
VAPSVLRLLQIGGDEAWEAPARAHIEATATVRIDAAAAAAVAERQAGHAADFGASDDDGSGDEDDGRNGLPLPPLPVNEATARAAWSVLCASVMQKSMSESSAAQCASDLMGAVDVDLSRTIDKGEFVGFFIAEEAKAGDRVAFEKLAWYERLFDAKAPSEVVGRAEKLFVKLDTDKDGELTVGELCTAMRRSGLSAAGVGPRWTLASPRRRRRARHAAATAAVAADA